MKVNHKELENIYYLFQGFMTLVNFSGKALGDLFLLEGGILPFKVLLQGVILYFCKKKIVEGHFT